MKYNAQSGHYSRFKQSGITFVLHCYSLDRGLLHDYQDIAIMVQSFVTEVRSFYGVVLPSSASL